MNVPAVIKTSVRPVRLLALHKQRLLVQPRRINRQTLLFTLRQIGLVQLDAVNTVARSHYTVMFSRVGLYNTTDLDSLQYPGRDVFEQWAHATCLLPVEDFKHFSPVFAQRRSERMRYGHRRILGDDVIDRKRIALRAVTEHGPVSPRFFGHSVSQPHMWWNRRPARAILDLLLYEGYLAVERRVNFGCIYDLVGRVIGGTSSRRLTPQDYLRWSTTRALSCMGVATAIDVADYYRNNIIRTREMLNELVEENFVSPVAVEGWPEQAYILTDDVPLLKKAQRGDFRPLLTTVLSPFDNLIWTRERVRRLFGFEYRNQMYAPVETRRPTSGYYVMPILHHDRIVGTLDPKAERSTSILQVKSLVLEPKLTSSPRSMKALAGAIVDFMRFNGCRWVRLETASARRALSGYVASDLLKR
jgi:uncharacterized protein YcaQ